MNSLGERLGVLGEGQGECEVKPGRGKALGELGDEQMGEDASDSLGGLMLLATEQSVSEVCPESHLRPKFNGGGRRLG